MKVNCDFLPVEYKSFLLDTTALGMAVAFAAATLVACTFSFTRAASERSRLTKEQGRLSNELTEVINQLRSITYDQAAIQDLITKFNFIQKAMGATDYPFLRFYQALENALPRTSDTQLKRISITKLTKSDGERFAILGRAESRSDVTQFEKSLVQSRTGAKQNFQEVKVLSTAVEKTDQWTFEMQFTFVP